MGSGGSCSNGCGGGGIWQSPIDVDGRSAIDSSHSDERRIQIDPSANQIIHVTLIVLGNITTTDGVFLTQALDRIRLIGSGSLIVECVRTVEVVEVYAVQPCAGGEEGKRGNREEGQW